MPIHIEEIFNEIIKYYYIPYYRLPKGSHLLNINNGYDDPKYRKRLDFYYEEIYNYIPTIINFNRISKIHNKWIQSMQKLDDNRINEIQHSLIWLNSQKLIKTVKKDLFLNYENAVKNSAKIKISDISFEYSVFLYNKLNSVKINGQYPDYNISRKWTYPLAFEENKKDNEKWTKYYKKNYIQIKI